MTVASQLKQTLAALKGAEATISTFAIHHPDEETQQNFSQAQIRLNNVIQDLEKRIQQVEFEEPQFKGY